MKQIISNTTKWATGIIVLAAMLAAAVLPLQKGYSQNTKPGQPKPYNTYQMNAAALRVAKDVELLKGISLVNASFLIRVYFHICRDDDRTNAAATEIQIQS